MYTLGIDIGTTNIKSVLFKEKALAVAQAVCEYNTDIPRASWAQQRADDWWDGVVGTIRKVLAESDPQLAGFPDGRILLGDIALPGFPENLRSALFGQGIGSVPHFLVQHHDDFLGPVLNAGQGLADAMGFRAGNQADRER